MANDRKDGVEGEGSYSGSKDYNERTKKFVQSGKVDKAAHDAEPKSERRKAEMEKAERAGSSTRRRGSALARSSGYFLNDPHRESSRA
jgi:hypothetical protein